MNDPSKKPIGTVKRSLQVWFSPQQLIDLAAVVVLASESMSVEDFKEIGITPDTLGELGLKLNKEIERLG